MLAVTPPWPLLYKKKKKEWSKNKGFCLTLQPSSPSSSSLCVLPQCVLSTYCAQLPWHSREPPFPIPPTHPPITMPALKKLVGLSYWVELDMVNVALAGPNCPEDTSYSGWIGQDCATVVRLSAFITKRVRINLTKARGKIQVSGDDGEIKRQVWNEPCFIL